MSKERLTKTTLHRLFGYVNPSLHWTPAWIRAGSNCNFISREKPRFTTTRRLSIKLSDQNVYIWRIISGVQQNSTTENIISAFESADSSTFSKESMDSFNNSMPHVRVVNGYARYIKEESYKYAIDDWRNPLWS